MHRFIARLPSTKACVAGFHSTASRAAITRFNMPAMSPTMTEGTIHQWKVKEGESFSAGDILLELETDKAQIDVDAPEDGILAKIILKDGEKAAVNQPIALLAEEGDDISNVEMPAEESSSAPEQPKAEEPKPAAAAAPPTPSTPMDHHELDTSKLKKPLSPAVLSLVLKHHIKDLDAIKASGPGGRILKGDVLAHLGLIPYKPCPPFRTSIAPPREEIVFAKPAVKEGAAAPKEEKPLPNFISKTVAVDDLLALRRALNEQNRTNVSVNDFIAKAATRALHKILWINLREEPIIYINYGLFQTTPDQLLYPNPGQHATHPTQLAFFEFIGLIIGKALYEGILLDVAFAEFFLKKCLGGINYLDDLRSLDPELYNGLIAVKNFRGNVEDLSLDFTLTQDEFGKTRTVELIPGGSNIPVTNANCIQYVYRVANYRLNTQIAKQCKAFFRGLSTIIDIKWLRMFNQAELQVLLGGASVPIDLDDLRANTVYAGYTEDESTVQNFWRALSSFDNEQRMKFIKFVTSCSRPPLLGFKELRPQLCIRNAGSSDDRLPTSSTCINLLKLPRFSNYEILRQKLLYAINAEAGFDLS